MLENLQEIYWDGLSVFNEGTESVKSASRIPKLLFQLASGKPSQRISALEILTTALPGSEAAAAALPFLFELAAAPQLTARAGILTLVGKLITPDLDGEVWTWASKAEFCKWIGSAREVAWAGRQVLLDELKDDDPTVRVAAAYALGGLAAHFLLGAANTLVTRSSVQLLERALLSALEAERSPAPKASLLIAIFNLPPNPSLVSVLENLAASGAESDSSRIAASLAATRHGLSATTLKILSDGLASAAHVNSVFEFYQEQGLSPSGRSPRKRHGLSAERATRGSHDELRRIPFPWFSTKRPFHWLIERVCSLDISMVHELEPAFVELLRHARAASVDLEVRPILQLAFPAIGTGKQHLTQTQRRFLQALFDNLSMWATDLGNVSFVFVEFELPMERARWSSAFSLEERSLTPSEARKALLKVAKEQQFGGEDAIKRLVLRQVVTKQFINLIKEFVELELLDISGGPKVVSDDDVEHIRSLVNLKHLRLPNANITDRGAQVLSEMKALQELSLYATKISNGAMTYLADLPNLVSLNVSKCSVSRQGIKELESRLPKCIVSFE